MRDLKDTVKIEKLCVEANEPVFVTKNGYGKLVIMDIEYFSKFYGKLYEALMINEALDEMNSGKVVDGQKYLDELKKKYNL